MAGPPAKRGLLYDRGASEDQSAQPLKPTSLGVRGGHGFTQNSLGESLRFGRCGDDPRTASMPGIEHGTPVLVRVDDESDIDDQRGIADDRERPAPCLIDTPYAALPERQA
jgi:hypothetical protein